MAIHAGIVPFIFICKHVCINTNEYILIVYRQHGDIILYSNKLAFKNINNSK